MAPVLTRILSDIHYGDRATRVVRLAQLTPLLDGVPHIVLNGDTLDTRPGPDPQHTAACREEVGKFFAAAAPSTTFLTGNHDSDISPHHTLDLADGRVFAVHGDIFFSDLVPWSKDAPLIARLIEKELRTMRPEDHHVLEHRFAMIRRVSAAVPQRHQSERHSLKYLVRYLGETIWPPGRVWKILSAWRLAPQHAADFARRYRPQARFIVSGHTHHPGIWPTPGGPIVINTGSYTRMLGGSLVELTATHLRVRRVDSRGGEFRLGAMLAEFPLAAA